MKIAIFSDLFLEIPGGICSSIRAQRDMLVKAGHEVVIFCPGWHEVAADEGVVVVPTHPLLKVNGAPLSKRPRKVEWFIERKFPDFPFDVVHVHYEGSCSIAGMRLARKHKVGLVQTMHGREDMGIEFNVPHPFKTFVASMLNFLHGQCIPHTVKVARDDFNGKITEETKRGEQGFDFGLAPTAARAKMWTLMVNHANFADYVVTPSEHFRRKLQHYGVAKPFTVISNGISDEMVAKFDRGGRSVRKLNKNETLRLFWNSRVSNEKRILPIIEAVSLMKRPVKFSVYGDGNQLEKAKRLVRKLGIHDKIEFFGRVSHDEILEKMRNEHLSAMGSFGFDNQSMILLEAEAVGLPVFFVDPDMAEVVPAEGAINCVKELISRGQWEASRRSAPTPAEIAEVLDAVKPEEIEKMSRAMYAQREEVLQSRQLEKLEKLYREVAKTVWLF